MTMKGFWMQVYEQERWKNSRIEFNPATCQLRIRMTDGREYFITVVPLIDQVTQADR